MHSLAPPRPRFRTARTLTRALLVASAALLLALAASFAILPPEPGCELVTGTALCLAAPAGLGAAWLRSVGRQGYAEGQE